MNEPPEQPAAWQESDSQDFARLGHVFTPGREEIETTLMELVPARRDESFVAVDVGCGQGWLSKALLRTFPSSHVIVLDGSPLMLAAAREACSRMRSAWNCDPSVSKTSPGSRSFQEPSAAS